MGFVKFFIIRSIPSIPVIQWVGNFSHIIHRKFSDPPFVITDSLLAHRRFALPCRAYPHNGIYRFNTESQSHVTYYYKTLRGKLLLCGFTARNDENWTMVHLNLYRGNLSREAFPLGASACLFLTSIRHSRESFHVVPLSPFCRKCRCDAHGNFTTWRFLRSNLFTDCHAVHHRFTLHRALSYSNICVH